MLRTPQGVPVNREEPTSNTDKKASINFFLDMTHPSADTLMAVFHEEFPAEPEPDFASNSFLDIDMDQMDFMSDFFSPSIDFDLPDTFANDIATLDLDNNGTLLEDILAQIRTALVSTTRSPSVRDIYDLNNGKPPNSNLDSATLDTLLQPNHARILIATYFRSTVPDFPITHEAAFYAALGRNTPTTLQGAQPACPELVLAVMLGGSLHRAPHDYVLAARKLMRVGNELIFARLQFAMRDFAVTGGRSGRASRGRLPKETVDIVAAALVANSALSTVIDMSAHGVMYLQSGLPTERLHQVASALRVCGLDKARRSVSLLGSGDEIQKWEDFVHEESCIR